MASDEPILVETLSDLIDGWSCAHCGLLCEGPQEFGTHVEGRTKGYQSCDTDVTRMEYGYRAHTSGYYPIHCLCSRGLL